jgi:uncharacterized protein
VAISYRLYDIIYLLVKKGAGLNIKDKKGNTPLMLAVIKGDEAIVKLLAASGANISLKNNAGKTALDLARENNYQQIVKLLEKRMK